MKKFSPKKPLILVLIIFWIFGGMVCSRQPSERYFDTAELFSEEVRLAILYPSMGSIKSLTELRKQGLITLENLIVIGIYHENERTNYQKSKEYVKENDLKWFKFHKISGELNRDVLFQKNSCTADFEEIFKKSDGIIFFGGADIPPYIYENKTNLLTRISTPYRHFLELSFIFHLLGGLQDESFKPLLESREKFPVLGICLGAQSLNIGTGGTLTQDIWSEKYGKKYVEDVITLTSENWHNNPFAQLYPEEKLSGYNMHKIKFIEDSKFCSMFGFTKEDTPFIISSHHQMVKKPGKGMIIAATSLDGRVVEAIEHDAYPHVLGVQFHPEFPLLWDINEKTRFTPQDKEGKNLLSFLKNNPPSFAFHKIIWAWFSQTLKENHERK